MSLNIENLSEEFNMGLEEDESSVESRIFTNPEESDSIILENINRANRLLDRVENNIINGSYSPREIEVAGQIINAVTSAASNLNQSYFNNISAKQKMLSLRLKEMKIRSEIKEDKKPGVTNNNLILTSREELLKLINKGEIPKQITYENSKE